MRVTFDWDDEQAKAGNYEAVLDEYGHRPWELRQSSGGSGYHLIVYGAHNDTARGFAMATGDRRQYDDDPKRLKLDELRWSEGSPFMQVLYRRKYMDRHEWPTGDGSGFSTGLEAEVIDESTEITAAPEREKIKFGNRLDYTRIARLLATSRFDSKAELARKLDVASSTVSRWTNDPDAGISAENREKLKRKARYHGLGHYTGQDKAADEVRYVDPEDERRTLVEYVDIPTEIKPEAKSKEYSELEPGDREYALLNIHTGSYNDAHSDKQLRHIHDDVTEHALEVLSPRDPDSGIKLNAGKRNEHFHGVSGWTREADSVNWERELMDEGEPEVYLDNLPEKPGEAYNAEEQPLFEVIWWDEDMTTLEWHVVGVWAGESIEDAVILKDSNGWW